MSGRTLSILLVLVALAAGAAMYWLQVYAYYRPVELGAGALSEGRVTITAETEAGPEELSPVGFEGIAADSSPIRFRACFELEDPSSLLSRARPAPDAVPLVAPGWFDCFDAAAIGADLEAGRATAILGQENVEYGIDRILAVYADGRAFAWDQINACGQRVFDGDPPPPGCPPPPG